MDAGDSMSSLWVTGKKGLAPRFRPTCAEHMPAHFPCQANRLRHQLLPFTLNLEVLALAEAAISPRFLKKRSRGRQATRTLSTVFPNSRSRTPPRSATGIRADARAYTPARDGGLREQACSTAFPGQPAKAEPSHLCETSRRGPHHRRARQRASPRSERRSRPIPHGPAAACSARG